MSTKHPKTPNIPDDKNDMAAWAESFGNLRYDQLAEFIIELHKKILSDSDADRNRGRNKLSGKLLDTAEHLFEAYFPIIDAWNICKPFMSESDKS